MKTELHCARCGLTRNGVKFFEYEVCCKASIEPQRAAAPPIRSSGLAVVGNGLYMRSGLAGDQSKRRFAR